MIIEIDGYHISYNKTGRGSKTVVILQGWGAAYETYNSIADLVNKKYTCVQLDFPGFGSSDEPRKPWTVDDYACFFCKFMQKIDINEAILVGHSFGGRVIIKLASMKNLPFEIEKIVLVDSAGLVPKKTVKQRIKIKKYKLLKHLFNNNVFISLFPELVEDWKRRQGSADYRNATPIMRKCLVLAVNEDLRHLLPSIKQDTLLIWGSNDSATPVQDGKIMEKLLPSSAMIVLDGAGHYPFLDNPSQFNAVLRSYLQIGSE